MWWGPPLSRTQLDGQNWPPSFVLKKLPTISEQSWWQNKNRRFSTLSVKTGWQSWGSLTNEVDNSESSSSEGIPFTLTSSAIVTQKNNNSSYHQPLLMHVIVSTVTVVDGTTNQCTGEFRCRILHLCLSTKSKFTLHGGWKDQWKNVSRVQEEIVWGTWPASCRYADHIFHPSYMEKMSMKATKMTSSVLEQGRRREGEKKNKLWCKQTPQWIVASIAHKDVTVVSESYSSSVSRATPKSFHTYVLTLLLMFISTTGITCT